MGTTTLIGITLASPELNAQTALSYTAEVPVVAHVRRWLCRSLKPCVTSINCSMNAKLCYYNYLLFFFLAERVHSVHKLSKGWRLGGEEKAENICLEG